MSDINIYILGAGKPYKGFKSNALKDATNSMKVLDWQLRELRSLKANIHFVGGYKYDEIVNKYPFLNFKINPFWDSTGSASSLLQCDFTNSTKNVFCYGDILFENNAIENLIDNQVMFLIYTHCTLEAHHQLLFQHHRQAHH